MRLFTIQFAILGVCALLLTACFHDSDDADYTAWRNENIMAYNDSLNLTDEFGQKVYSEYTPEWEKSISILLRWHKESVASPNQVRPLSTSTCHVKYTLTNINGDTLDSSAKFACKPNQMITGFMAALMQMTTGDTVTAVIPYTAGYGVYGYGNVYPYSTLVFGIRLDSISPIF